jgi:hypothetical protein
VSLSATEEPAKGAAGQSDRGDQRVDVGVGGGIGQHEEVG